MKVLRARKRFGQHFLRDRHVIGQIIEAMALHASDHVVEIGPGQGALTRALARRMSHFEAVEFDRD
ncbi:MAG: 16S rRNA (adenine(1518)-N(6)/adenine(1519)-N(6))-dimethyltransferase, partial [Gammaproteobacteria bacterium]|nr:16S rRNA (adenine(1518)-N(6)/adenine(1519)-N(6))-dimethyltransferase [Gammaproteobacteria bacterium]